MLIPLKPVTLSDVLEYLSTATQAPSTTGVQLDMLRNGTVGEGHTPNPDTELDRIQQRIHVIRAVDRLAATQPGRAYVGVLRMYAPWNGLRGAHAVVSGLGLPETKAGLRTAEKLVTEAIRYVQRSI